MDQFRDFYTFCKRIQSTGMKAGIVKVIPRDEWLEKQPEISEALKKIKIANPIRQKPKINEPGVLLQQAMPQKETYTVEEWASLCAAEKERLPDFDKIKIWVEDQYPSGSALPSSQDRNQDQKCAWMAEHLLSDCADPAGWIASLCEELENGYWNTLHQGTKGSIYGADVQVTLFDASVEEWNFTKLDSVLTRMLRRVVDDGRWTGVEEDSETIEGIDTPYLYFGSWGSTFAWHVENICLSSINYIHSGAPEQWYGVPQGKSKLYEETLRTLIPEDAKACKEFIRLKRCIFRPTQLPGTEPLSVVQYANNLNLTFPQGYHSGFNYGYSCAEAVDFALDDWVQPAMKADWCRCGDEEHHSIDVQRLYKDAIEAEDRAAGKARERDED